MRRLLLFVSLFLLASVLVAPAASAQTCPTGWGSLPKVAAAMGPAPVSTVRAGVQPCYDRFVIEVSGSAAGYRAEYVDQVRADGSGAVVTTPGGARIQFTAHHPWMSGPRVGASVANVSGFPVLRSVVYAGSFEGYTSFGVGTRARLPFRVFTLSNPGRIVLDVARTW